MTPNEKQLSRNLWTSWVGYGLRIGISFLFVPYITSVFGDARYGVWVLVFQTINYFALLDFGLEKALLRFVSKYFEQGRFQAINRTLNTSFNLYLIAGSLIIAGAWLTSTFLFDWFQIDNPLFLAEGKTALTIIGFYMGTRFYLLPFAGALGGFQRFDISNTLHMAEDILRAVIMAGLLWTGYGLVPLAWCILAMSLLRQLVAIIYVKRIFPELIFKPSLADRESTRQLFDYSRITLGITLAWLIIFNTDTVLLGMLVSSSAAGVYAPGAQLMLYMRNAVNVIASPLTAAVSRMESTGDWDGIRRLYLKGVRYASYLSFLMATGVILYARPFVALWLPVAFGESAEVMRILAVSSAFFIPQIIGNAILFGVDRHAALLRVLVVEAAAKIGLSIILIPAYGVIGMAYAAAIPQLVLYLSLYPYFISRVVSISPVVILLTSLRAGLMAMAASLPACVLMGLWLPPTGWPAFLIDVAVVVLIGATAGWFVLTPDDRDRLLKKLSPGA